MRTGSVKKYVIPNIPYLFVLWACLKLGTAYRLAAGADFPHKLMGLGQTVGPAFADLAPGLDPFDWLVGIVGAVGFRLLIYFKSKNAKKFRRDEEFGSARWGGPKDIAPFVDPVFENNVILTGTELLTMNTRPKNPANARNLNACVIGSSGSGKTRFWLTPQLLQASAKKKGGCSFVVVDPKGGVLSQVGAFLQRRGYRIKVFNSIDFTKSMHYNPLSYIRNEADILKFVDTLIANTKGEGNDGRRFILAKQRNGCKNENRNSHSGDAEDNTFFLRRLTLERLITVCSVQRFASCLRIFERDTRACHFKHRFLRRHCFSQIYLFCFFSAIRAVYGVIA